MTHSNANEGCCPACGSDKRRRWNVVDCRCILKTHPTKNVGHNDECYCHDSWHNAPPDASQGDAPLIWAEETIHLLRQRLKEFERDSLRSEPCKQCEELKTVIEAKFREDQEWLKKHFSDPSSSERGGHEVVELDLRHLCMETDPNHPMSSGHCSLLKNHLGNHKAFQSHNLTFKLMNEWSAPPASGKEGE